MKKFIAYFDYLGFGKFIEKNDLEYQLKIINNNFRDMERALSQGKSVKAPHGFIADLSHNKVNCINFSDTIVYWTNDDSTESLKEILEVADTFNWQTTTHFFPARGALVHGEMEYIDFKHTNTLGGVYNINSVFGKGLVNVHQKAESQQWSGTVIDQSIIELINNRELNADTLLEPFAKKYQIPYKNGIILDEEYAFCLVKGLLNDVAFENVSKNIHENFSKHNKDTSSADVQEKIENTIQFLASFKG